MDASNGFNLIMAHISTDWCYFCKKETQHLNSKCRLCQDRESREKWISWNSLDNDTKINQLLERIEKLEAGPQKYA